MRRPVRVVSFAGTCPFCFCVTCCADYSVLYCVVFCTLLPPVVAGIRCRGRCRLQASNSFIVQRCLQALLPYLPHRCHGPSSFEHCTVPPAAVRAALPRSSSVYSSSSSFFVLYHFTWAFLRIPVFLSLVHAPGANAHRIWCRGYILHFTHVFAFYVLRLF